MSDPKLSKTPIKKGKYTTWHQWTYDGVLTEAEAAQKQQDAGYHPCGYGFYSFRVNDGKTTWECSQSCD